MKRISLALAFSLISTGAFAQVSALPANTFFASPLGSTGFFTPRVIGTLDLNAGMASPGPLTIRVNGSGTHNWLVNYGYGDGASLFIDSSTANTVMATFASRTSDLPTVPPVGSVAAGLINWGFNDKTTNPIANWAMYNENRVFSGSNGGVAVESEITNYATAAKMDSFGFSSIAGKFVSNIHLGTGGGCGLSGYLCWDPVTSTAHLGVSNPTTAAMSFINNGSAPHAGLLFFAGSIAGATGFAGFAPAIEMTFGHTLQWDYCDVPGSCTPHNKGAQISSTVTLDDNKQFLNFANLGMLLQDDTNTKIYLEVAASKTYVNYPIIIPSASGTAMQYFAAGTDTHISLRQVPKGNGVTDTPNRADTSYGIFAPVAAATVVMSDGSSTAVIVPAGTLATLTVQLPTCNAFFNGKHAEFSSTQVITALTVTATAGTVISAPASLAVGIGPEYICLSGTPGWYRLH